MDGPASVCHGECGSPRGVVSRERSNRKMLNSGQALATAFVCCELYSWDLQ